MHIIPPSLKPVVHFIFDRILGLFQLHLPRDVNLKSKLIFLLQGSNEKDLLFLINKYVKPGDNIADIGANIGLTVKWFSKAVGKNGRVYAFEPERSNFRYLCANNLNNDNVYPHMIALSSKIETRNLMLNPVSGSGNSFYGSNQHAIQEVKCQTLDGYFDIENITKVDCIKIDVEGAELDVLGGMHKTLNTHPKCLLIIEYCPDNLNSAGTSGEELISTLKESGFYIYAVVRNGSNYETVTFDDPGELITQRGYLNLLCSKTALS